MKEKTNKAVMFLRKNFVYFILGLCAIAVVASVLVAVLTASNKAPIDQTQNKPNVEQEKPNEELPSDKEELPNLTPNEPVETKIEFVMPISSSTSINGYSEVPVPTGVGNVYQAHLAVDFMADAGTSVLACYKGKVEKVEYDFLNGYSVTIDHGDGLKSYYNSLAEDVLVKVGDSVATGAKIGTVADTNQREYKLGNHLHFAVFEDGGVINPDKYLSFEEK